MLRRAFALVELMVVVAIISILMTIAAPVMVKVRGAAYQFAAVQSIRGLMLATNMYAGDNDETYPIAVYNTPTGLMTWFGAQREDGTFDPKRGLLSNYSNGRPAEDRSFKAKEYLGDQSGFGYNWGYVGSDFNVTGDYRGFPNCINPARMSEIERPSDVVAFSTSAYFFAPWQEGGDSQIYDFGFIDPPKYWNGKPNVHFRFGELPLVDVQAQKVTPRGQAIFLFLDGSVRTMGATRVTDAMFERSGPDGSDR